ncbi:MAG: ATP-binding protein [Ectothiorhodospiraceae bacterium AqS1]|nr:ATP-binding protein [Ectothiorhodospiraceae bacterium AqS1]
MAKTTRKNRTAISTGPSRDGHEFHEAWTARKSMQLLLPKDGLVGIAVEGLSRRDESRASADTIEIADITIYYGEDVNFTKADRIEIVQFKYSPKNADKSFRASDAKKTINKFAASYVDYKKNYGAKSVTKKIFFELITNRPIYPDLHNAIKGIASGQRLTGNTKKQGDQFESAADLSGKDLREFASKCYIKGTAGELKDTKEDLRKTLINWSATTDAIASARLGDIRNMVRKKAGCQEEKRNMIRRVDVLSALGLSDVDELLPCPSNLPDVGEVVMREQLRDVVDMVPNLDKPLLVHAEGGVGKTVFLQSMKHALSQDHEVVFFDCFGGGGYRSPEDCRHLANRGLVHIANILACRGLSDPILPSGSDDATLFRQFRKRLEQCVDTLKKNSPDRKLILFIDAIDNAAEYAKEIKDQAFPTQLVEAFSHSGPVAGVKLVLSSRTHRVSIALPPEINCQRIKLNSFTIHESEAYLRARLPDVTSTDVDVAQSRSVGNARILEHIVVSDRSLLAPSEIKNSIKLDELIQQRINSALKDVITKGHKKNKIDTFLAGLAVLPPPIPLEDYALAHGMEIGAIESFAADLAPLLERTKYGITFRDEPTETFVRKAYGMDNESLGRVAKNFLENQEESFYAAKALPSLLLRLDDRENLFNLAFDKRLPESIVSAVGCRRIRYARLCAATIQFSRDKDWNKLVQILVELSSVEKSDQRGVKFILNNPDLVIAANDSDALSRLFETKTDWPGERYTRLVIANILSGEIEDASRYYRDACEWIRNNIESRGDDHDRIRLEYLDWTALSLYWMVQGQPKRAAEFIENSLGRHSFEILKTSLILLRYTISRNDSMKHSLNKFISSLESEIICLTGCLCFLDITDHHRRNLLKKLSNACEYESDLQDEDAHSRKILDGFLDGLRECAAIAISLEMKNEARKIFQYVSNEKPYISFYTNRWSGHNIYPFVFRMAFISAIEGSTVNEHDIVPKDISSPERLPSKDRSDYDRERHYLNHRIGPLTEIIRSLAALLSAPISQADKPFRYLLDVWKKYRKWNENRYHDMKFNPFFQSLGEEVVLLALRARSDLKKSSMDALIKCFDEEGYAVPSLIRFISVISRNQKFHAIASEQAVKVSKQIEIEDQAETRASRYANLARAILFVSTSEAKEYFRIGLEQLDSIGSSDYEYTKELMKLASTLKGNEIKEKDFHVFGNICELNMNPNDEPRFPWKEFGTAMSRVAGLQGLAKISRLHDRNKVDLHYTLLPYLIALIQDGKISPEYAVALNQLANPAELWEVNTEKFAESIYNQSPKDKRLIVELIRQYEKNNPSIISTDTVNSLHRIAKDILGRSHPMTKYLSEAYSRLDSLRDDRSVRVRDSSDVIGRLGFSNKGKSNKKQLRDLALKTDFLNENSFANAVAEMKSMNFSHEEKQKFFTLLRKKIKVNDWTNYVNRVANLETLDRYDKFKELMTCKNEWSKKSIAINKTYRDLATPLIDVHVKEFIGFEGLSDYMIKEVSNITGADIPDLVNYLIQRLLATDCSVPAHAWLGIATVICRKTDSGIGQKSLSRLLDGDIANLTSTVVDGPWKPEAYSAKDETAVAAGFVWQMLGSARTSDRWRAAHSVCIFSRFECWEVIDALVEKLSIRDSKAFQAPELPFYYLHAKLWLLIALARIAIDAPKAISKYYKALISIATSDRDPHVSIRHFASNTVLICNAAGEINLSSSERGRLLTINRSNLSPLNVGQDRHDTFYKSRPSNMSDPEFKFHLDYDFNEYDVRSLARVFALPGWEIKDRISKEIRQLDCNVKSMYEDGGREIRKGQRNVGISKPHHGYGYYLGCHALLRVAGQLLETYSVVEENDGKHRWSEWLSSQFLARKDNYWLSDTMDRTPLDTMIDVMESRKKKSIVTGNREKLLSLVGITSTKLESNLVVEGYWKSRDGVDINIRSALVDVGTGKFHAEKLVSEGPMSVSLPTKSCDNDDCVGDRKNGYRSWIVTPSLQGGKELDRYDPFSVPEVECRPYFSPEITSRFSLSWDMFGRICRLPRRKIAAESSVWDCGIPDGEDRDTGIRLRCKTDFLKQVLDANNAELIVLIILRRYDSGKWTTGKGRFFHSVAALRIKPSLKFEYYKGVVNHITESES